MRCVSLTPSLSRKREREKEFNTWDAIKILGLLLMFVDHSGAFIYIDQQWLRAIGRGAAPIFMFLAGFASSYRFRWDVFALALLLSVSDTLVAGHVTTQNILFSIIACRALFAWMERRGKKITRLHEWYIGAVMLFPSLILVQYGSMGLLFALCGHIMRRREAYPHAPRFTMLCFATYAVAWPVMASFSPANLVLTCITVYGVWRLLSRLQIRPIAAAPAWLLHTAKYVSYYSAYIYVFHLIALEWITGVAL